MQVLCAHRTEHDIDPLFASVICSHIRVEKLVNRHIEHRHQLIENIEARMLAIILMVHDGARVAVNDIGQLFLGQPLPFPCPFDSYPNVVKIKFAVIAFMLHIITTLCNFTFQVAQFERYCISC